MIWVVAYLYINIGLSGAVLCVNSLSIDNHSSFSTPRVCEEIVIEYVICIAASLLLRLSDENMKTMHVYFAMIGVMNS